MQDLLWSDRILVSSPPLRTYEVHYDYLPTAIVRWLGASGRVYEFETVPIGTWTYFPVPGVYIFCRDIGNDQFSPLYIGETDDFSRRIGSELVRHHKWDEVRLRGATHIATLVVPGHYTARLAVETDLRHGCKPPCNDQGTRSVA